MSFSIEDTNGNVPFIIKSGGEGFDFSKHTNYVDNSHHLPPTFKPIELQLRPLEGDFGASDLGIVLLGPQNVKISAVIHSSVLQTIFRTIRALQNPE